MLIPNVICNGDEVDPYIKCPVSQLLSAPEVYLIGQLITGIVVSEGLDKPKYYILLLSR